MITNYIFCRNERRHRFVCVKCKWFHKCEDRDKYEVELSEQREAQCWSRFKGQQSKLPTQMTEVSKSETPED